MARVPVPPDEWRFPSDCIVDIVLSFVGILVAWWLLQNGRITLSLLSLAFSLLVLRGCVLYVQRSHYRLALRGNRKVSFNIERYKTTFKEGDYQMQINTVSEGSSVFIHPRSIKRWEPPHQNELVTGERREDIFDLLCEEIEDKGMAWSLSSYNDLVIKKFCPRCERQVNAIVDVSFGPIRETVYSLGSVIQWRENKPVNQGGRPPKGSFDEYTGATCPHCGLHSFMIVKVRDDRIESAEVNYYRKGQTRDTSIPILNSGVITRE